MSYFIGGEYKVDGNSIHADMGDGRGSAVFEIESDRTIKAVSVTYKKSNMQLWLESGDVFVYDEPSTADD